MNGKYFFHQNPKVMKPNKILGILAFIGVIGFCLYMLFLSLPMLIVFVSNIFYLGVFGILFIVIIAAIFNVGKRLFK